MPEYSNIIIRVGTEDDFSKIITLIKEFAAFQKMPDKMTNSVELMEREKEHFNFFVAESQDGSIIGYATYFFAYFTWIGKSLYMDDLYVQEKYRGHGLGKRLMQKVFDFARSVNCRKVRWQVSNWNTSAINFYKSLGAVVDDMENNCDLYLQ